MRHTQREKPSGKSSYAKKKRGEKVQQAQQEKEGVRAVVVSSSIQEISALSRGDTFESWLRATLGQR